MPKPKSVKEIKIVPPPYQTPPRELIVVTKPGTGLRAEAMSLKSTTGANVSSLEKLLKVAKARLVPVFGNEDRVMRALAAAPAKAKETFSKTQAPQLERFYRVVAPDDQLDKIAAKLLETQQVEAAYVRSGIEPAVLPIEALKPPSLAAPPSITPDLTSMQGYLGPAPGGIDAHFAWQTPGAKGFGVSIIDIEAAWRFTHEDLNKSQRGMVGGEASSDIYWRNHGTAVAGVFSGDENEFGINGICPLALFGGVSIYGEGQNAAKAITDAANASNPGDIILIELHAPGPRYNFLAPNGQRGYVAMEFWPDIFAAILYATSVRGVIVVEAAGNGYENFDDPFYDTTPAGFPPNWTNPFNLNNPQSGAIMVGAGAPPTGNYGPARSRLDFSNYGARIDAQGWGRDVVTCGYGDLQGGDNEDLWYTEAFSGTSSASPIVVGAIACTQGALRVGGQPLLTPETARTLLRSTGTPQQDFVLRPATQRIGNLPDIRQMVGAFRPSLPTTPLYRYWNAHAEDHFYTTNWAEIGFDKYGWVFEKIQCHIMTAQAPGLIALLRYWNLLSGDHFYTTSFAELAGGRYGWRYEGIQGWVFAAQTAGTIPLYRYWNPEIADHFYTTDYEELGEGKLGWNLEGILCYVYERPAHPAGVTVTAPPESPGSSSPSYPNIPLSFQTSVSKLNEILVPPPFIPLEAQIS